MIITRFVKEIKSALLPYRAKSSIGLVPTMGALHKGHLALIQQSKNENDTTVCSIFVNPIQFNNKNDLERYPKTPESDTDLLISAGCDMLFMPDIDEMYPKKPENSGLDLGHLNKIMEAISRPGHFNGVVTVVKRLFEIVEPHRAYFGRKDFQQLAVIRYMVKKLPLPVEIIAHDTVREPDGLAMSSRNALLKPGERKEAPFLYRTLIAAKEKARNTSVPELKKWVEDTIKSNPAFRLDYFEMVDADTLLPLKEYPASGEIVGCLAARLGDVRLIDNIVIKD